MGIEINDWNSSTHLSFVVTINKLKSKVWLTETKPMIIEYCRSDEIKGKFILIFFTIRFELEEDAMLFKLRFI